MQRHYFTPFSRAKRGICALCIPSTRRDSVRVHSNGVSSLHLVTARGQNTNETPVFEQMCARLRVQNPRKAVPDASKRRRGRHEAIGARI